MKHPTFPTIMVVLMFVLAQLVGIMVIKEYVNIEETARTGETVKNEEVYTRVGVEPPSVGNESLSFLFIILSVLLGTVLILLIIKFKKGFLWKVWYLFAVFFGLSTALNPFIFQGLNFFAESIRYLVLLVVSGILSAWKVFKPNVIVHNVTEVFIYGGIAALLVPISNVVSAVLMLVAISIYDAYAVWKSKHMIKMAKFQNTTKVFAGLSVPYGKRMEMKVPSPKEKSGNGTAILGGGDIAFPLIFSGVIMKTTGSLIPPLVITVTTTIALAFLLLRGEKDKFYPAMPFLTIGCFAGLLVSLVL